METSSLSTNQYEIEIFNFFKDTFISNEDKVNIFILSHPDINKSYIDNILLTMRNIMSFLINNPDINLHDFITSIDQITNITKLDNHTYEYIYNYFNNIYKNNIDENKKKEISLFDKYFLNTSGFNNSPNLEDSNKIKEFNNVLTYLESYPTIPLDHLYLQKYNLYRETIQYIYEYFRKKHNLNQMKNIVRDINYLDGRHK